MQKKISLLSANGVLGETSEQIREAIYNLNIDRMAQYACESKKQVDYFLSVLCRSVKSKEDAEYRAEILRDFIENPSLLASLIQTFHGYDVLPEETNEVLSEIFRYGMPATTAGMLDCAYEELYVNAHYARNVIAYFSEIHDTLSDCEVKSLGLKKIKDFCREMSDSKCITELENAASKFKSENIESYKFALNVCFGEDMSISSCSIAEVFDIDEKEKRSLRSIFKKNAPVNVNIGSVATDNARNATSSAITELSGIFSDIASSIYDIFKGIGDELAFYKVAVDIKNRIQKSGMYCSFPLVLDAEADTVEAAELYDMLLLVEGKDAKSIVANDANLTQSILVRGDNNCGKTSFLRAVGTAVLFAQNGLFVCAKSMRSSIRTAILTHFSSAEKDFSDNDAAGRFEGEVKEMAALIRNVKPYSLALLNETFQTTAYREGAEGMKYILEAFTRMKCKYAFVTHISAIFEMIDRDKATFLTAKGYRLLSETRSEK